MEFTLASALASYPVGQRRTSPNKPFVFLCGNEVWKGPYSGQRLMNVISRSDQFAQWHTPCVVTMLGKPIETPDGTFIRFPNLMADYQLTTEPYTETNTGLTYNVLTQPPVMDVRQALAQSQHWIWNKLEDILVALCCAYVLSVGDMNLRNLLADPATQSLYLIDYDDTVTQERSHELFYFNKNPSQNIPWLEHARPLYHTVANRLQSLNDPHPRMQRVIDLLRRHGLNMCRPYLRIVTHDIGHMVWRGLRGGASKTYSGLDLDVAKSALQKYIRRNLPDKAVKAAVELYRMGEVDGLAAVTNMYNRLAIIAAEDVGPSNLPLVLYCLRRVQEKNRHLPTLIAMVKSLAASPKTRIMSHAWSAYGTAEGRVKAANRGIRLDSDFAGMESFNIHHESDPHEMKAYINMFLTRLGQRDRNAFTWASWYLQQYGDRKVHTRSKYIQGTKGTTSKAPILLWRALYTVLEQGVYDTLVQSYFAHTESRPFLQLAIVIALYEIPYGSYELPHPLPTSDATRLLLGQYTLDIDDYVLDKHTAAGRRAGKTIADFVREGAIVLPQDERYYDPVLEAIYQDRS